MITGNLVIRSEEQVLAEQTTIHPCQRSSLFTHLTHCLENLFGFLHCAYLHFFSQAEVPNSLRPVVGFPNRLGWSLPHRLLWSFRRRRARAP